MTKHSTTNQFPQSDQGTCFGFRVRSAIPLRCLREGDGAPLDIPAPGEQAPAGPLESPIMEWAEVPGQPAYARLHQAGDQYWLWSNGLGWTMVEPTIPRINLPPTTDPALHEELIWTVPAALCLLYRRHLVLHAGAVEVGGRVILLAAAGRAGKSTLAAAFAQAGYRVLSEDVSCLRLDPQPSVVPGPAMLRLRPDVLTHLTLPGAQLLRKTATRLTLALDPDRRGTCDPLPVRSVVVLEASANGFALDRIPPAEAIRRLWSLSFKTPVANWVSTCFAQLAQLAAHVPILTFARPLRLQELRATVDYLVNG